MSADLGIRVPITVTVAGEDSVEALSMSLGNLKDVGDSVSSSATKSIGSLSTSLGGLRGVGDVAVKSTTGSIRSLSADLGGLKGASSDAVASINNLSISSTTGRLAAMSAGVGVQSLSTDLGILAEAGGGVEKSTTNWTKALSLGGGLAGHAVIAVDRLTIAQNAVENAQIRQMIATDRLNYVLDKYGAGSREATQAQRELEISTRGVDIANQRMYVRMIFGVGILIPEMISQFKNLKKVLDSVTLSTIFQTEATHGLTRARLLLIGVSTLGIGAVIGYAAGTALASQVPSSDVNVYANNFNVQANNPQDFTERLQQQTQASRMSR